MITRLGYIGFVVKDFDASASFLVDGLGFRETGRDGERAWYGLNSRHHQVRLTAGSENACDGVGFDVVDAAALEELRERVGGAGLEILSGEPSDQFTEQAFTFQVPSGPALELCFNPQIAPSTGDPFDLYRVRHAPRRLKKLGHVSLVSPEPEKLEQVFVDVLGFRVSDRFPGVLTWARCNRDHHCIGFAVGEKPGIHHYAYEIESFGYYEALADALANLGCKLIWGPGRHGPGNNLFVYFEDPEGTMVEVYADLAQIENEESYEPTSWEDLQEAGNRWGPMPPDRWFEMHTPFAERA